MPWSPRCHRFEEVRFFRVSFLSSRQRRDSPSEWAGKKSDQAHPPIHSLKAGGNLQGNEAKVYEFVTRHFQACVSADALGKGIMVRIDIAQEEHKSRGNLRRVPEMY